MPYSPSNAVVAVVVAAVAAFIAVAAVATVVAIVALAAVIVVAATGVFVGGGSRRCHYGWVTFGGVLVGRWAGGLLFRGWLFLSFAPRLPGGNQVDGLPPVASSPENLFEMSFGGTKVPTMERKFMIFIENLCFP